MTRQAALPPTLAPRLIGREAAAAYVSLAPNTFDELAKSGKMPRLKSSRVEGRLGTFVPLMLP
jgi:hypothetical protein